RSRRFRVHRHRGDVPEGRLSARPRRAEGSAQGLDTTRHYACVMRAVTEDLVAIADALARRELTSAALVDSALARYRETEHRVHAWAWLDMDRAGRLARASDERRASGAAVGRLEGIPIGVKDIFDTAGIPTECGSAMFAGRVPDRSAAVVRAAETAGAIILGKTVTAELAYLTPGPTRNPWNQSRTPGGSSMGSAAAVSA